MSKVLKATTVQALSLFPWSEDRLLPEGAVEAPIPAEPAPLLAASLASPPPAFLPVPEPADLSAPVPEPEPPTAIAIDANSLLAAVRAEADALLTAAHSEAAALRQQARERGFNEGRDDGYAQGQIEARQELDSLRRQAQSECESLFAQAHDDLLGLAVSLAQRIVITELSLRPDVLTDMVADALRRLGPGSPAQVRVNPQDLPLLEASKHPLHAGSKGPVGVQLVPDAGLARGEFLVQGSHGHVDGRLASQFSELAAFTQEAAEGRACEPTGEPYGK